MPFLRGGYCLPGEIDAGMCSRLIRIIGGPFSGYERRLLSVRSSRIRQLLVELRPEMIELLEA